MVNTILHREENCIIAPLGITHDLERVDDVFFKRTILDEWLKYETWTPAEGALIVNGWLPPPNGCTTIPTSGRQARLSGDIRVFEDCSFVFVDKLLKRWGRQLEAAKRVPPRAWLQWCRDTAEDYECRWLVAVENAIKVNEAKIQSDIEPDESDEDMVARLRGEGIDSVEITRRLVGLNPRISRFRLGKLVEPEPPVGTSMYQKRGGNWLDAAGFEYSLARKEYCTKKR